MSEKSEWPGYFLIVKLHDPDDEAEHRRRAYTSVLLKLAEDFYGSFSKSDSAWEGSWEKLKARFDIQGLKAASLESSGDRWVPKCLLCGAALSPYYNLYGVVRDTEWEHGPSVAPMPAKSPFLTPWHHPEFAICTNGHGIARFQEHALKIGQITFYYMFHPKSGKRFTVFSVEYDPCQRKNEFDRHSDEITELIKTMPQDPLGLAKFSGMTDLSFLLLDTADMRRTARLLCHERRLKSSSLFKLLADAKLLDPEPFRSFEFRKRTRELAEELLAGNPAQLGEELAIGFALGFPEYARRLRDKRGFREACINAAKEAQGRHPKEGWAHHVVVALILKLYFPQDFEDLGGFKDVTWGKGSQYFIPQLRRRIATVEDLAALRLLFPERYEELMPKGKDFSYLLRYFARQARYSMDECDKSSSRICFGYKSQLRALASLKLMFARDVTFDPATFELRVTMD